jgi:hypothetical protein
MVLSLSQESFISLSWSDEIIFPKYTIICLGKNLEPEHFFFQFAW